jgi:hypothetical protein
MAKCGLTHRDRPGENGTRDGSCSNEVESNRVEGGAAPAID